MSAGAISIPTVSADLSLVAPKFGAAVERAIARCRAANLPAVVYEANRSAELQAIYFARGRTIIPPNQTVTNASSNLFSWHGFGLAVDVIHETKEWSVGDDWFASVAEQFKAEGLKWGGDWKMKDLPHFQWGLCKPSPSDTARSLLASGGLDAVWRAVNAV